MTKSNVKLIRMWSGEDVVTDLIKETADSVLIKNPIVAIPAGQQGQIAFAPWSPVLCDKIDKLEITKKYVVYISDPQEDIIEQYNKMYSVIETPLSKKLQLP
tara:strand:- start:497 stop:802 length:306 start_codon:yes stop_codon:yes gene_type:complete